MNSHFSSVKCAAWISSLRPRTLPLAITSIIMGTSLAVSLGNAKPLVAFLSLLTAALLQILSNLANDYGDAIKGSDTATRIGPLRGMQKGIITQNQMRNALLLCLCLTISSGVSLIIIACENPRDVLGFLLLGLAAIIAAITYTVGKNPYGYLGLGDISVLIFFGWLSVAGTTYLHLGEFHAVIMLPATACGLLAVAVLNINNLRDIDDDKEHGKNTLAVRLGPKCARYYHASLLVTALLCLIMFSALRLHHWYNWLFLIVTPLLFQQAYAVLSHPNAIDMRPLFGSMVKTALITNLLFSLCLLLN